MTPQGLLASAGINIGLAMAILSLFSVLKKQPFTAVIYYARRLSHHHPIAYDPISFNRLFVPSFSWIPRALGVSDDEILRNSGLDALVIIRLFKLGIKFFLVCSLIGLLLLLPINFSIETSVPNSRSLNSFTISNVTAGSDRLWVHFTCLWFISFYGLYLLYKEYKEILDKRILCLHKLKDRPDMFTVLVREIPICSEHGRRGCNVHHFFTRHYQHSYQSYQMLYDGKELGALWDKATSMQKKIQHLTVKHMKKRSKRTASLVEPLTGDASKIEFYEEKLERICDIMRDMQHETMLQQLELPVAFVTFKSRVGAALATQSQQHPHPFLWITEPAPEPRDVLWKNLSTPSRRLLLYKIGFFLVAALLTIFFTVPVTAVQGIAKFEKLKKWFPPAMAIQLIPGLRSIITGYLPSVILNLFIYIVPYSLLGMAQFAGYTSRSATEIKVCTMVFYFLVGNVFFLSLLSGSLLDELGQSFSHPGDFPSRLARAVAAQIEDVYPTIYETCGQYWPYVHSYIFFAIVLMQITMIGLFGLKAKPAASIATVPLLIFSLLFNEYCKLRFLPSFQHNLVQNAGEADELDKRDGRLEINSQNAACAYCPPFLTPISSNEAGSSSNYSAT